ncbi:MAG: response regulator, partial [Candidatus Omnitrophica bacterium]|nr:response regulator [Candidatus Omnitrophota bacterium]
TNNESGFSEEEAFKQLKILEVDDDDGCSALMCIYLKELGIKEIDTAFNGEEAIEKIKKTSYDIILMDIKMPVMDGIEATKTIREKISSDLPIIAVTAFVMPEEQNIYFESGMNEFCAKPVNMKMLKEKILKLCKIK